MYYTVSNIDALSCPCIEMQGIASYIIAGLLKFNSTQEVDI